MSKVKIKVDKGPVDEVLEAPVVAEEVVTVPTEESWPEVTATGRYVAVPFKEGYVVYNPTAQRVSGLVSRTVANDIVRQQNTAAQIKG